MKNFKLLALMASVICLSTSQSHPGRSQALRHFEHPDDQFTKDMIIKTAPWIAPVCIATGVMSGALWAAQQRYRLTNYAAKLRADQTALAQMTNQSAPVKLASASWWQWLRGKNKVDFTNREVYLSDVNANFAAYDYKIKNFSYIKPMVGGLLVGTALGLPLHTAVSMGSDVVKDSRDPVACFLNPRR